MSNPTAFHITRITDDGQFASRAVTRLVDSLRGQYVEVSIRKRRSYRTLPQNNYYFGVVIALLAARMREMGVTNPRGGLVTDEEVHLLMRLRFLKRSVLLNPDSGEYEDIIMSTTELTKSEFGDYVTQVKQFAVEVYDLHIPDPNEQLTFA